MLLKKPENLRNGYKNKQRMADIHNTCTVDGCEFKHKAKGFCSKHYQRFKTNGSTNLLPKREVLPFCKIDGCDLPTRSWNLCSRHYYKLRTKGLDGEYTVVGNDKKRLKINSSIDDNGCWIWKKSKWNGYGKTILKGKNMAAHRASWTVFMGEIPQGMQINHKCHVRACINPDHLYVGTQKENVRDTKLAGRKVQVKGSAVTISKLKERDIPKIRIMIQNKVSKIKIADMFDVSLSCIRSIEYKKSWKHVK